MKIGVITDIHNNLAALNAVLERFDQLGCGTIICCGDIIGIGPWPEETVRRMMQIPHLLAVRGNHEKYLLEGMPETFPNEERMEPEERRHHQWEHGLLSEASAAFLKTLPWRVDTVIEGVRISILHYCMDRDGHYIRYTPNPSKQDLQTMFDGVDSDVIFYGHDHRRSICMGDRVYINAGSLGCPAQERNIARAAIAVIKNGRVDVQPIDVPYEVQPVVQALDERQVPDAANIKKYFYGIQ